MWLDPDYRRDSTLKTGLLQTLRPLVEKTSAFEPANRSGAEKAVLEVEGNLVWPFCRDEIQDGGPIRG